MMDILPIKFLTDEDASTFGSLNVTLGKLSRAGLPVEEGLVSADSNSQPRVEITHKKLEAAGTAFYDPLEDDVIIATSLGKPEPADLKRICEIVTEANKKLFIPHVYHWILERGVKLVGLSPYTPPVAPVVDPANNKAQLRTQSGESRTGVANKAKSAVKVFLDLSGGVGSMSEVDGIYIASGGSFDELVIKILEASENSLNPVLVNLASGVALEALEFVRHKKGLTNVHIVIPSVRSSNELLRIKRELAVRKLARKTSLQQWVELEAPENIINLEEYLFAEVDGVILNLDKLVGYLNGFDPGSKDEEKASLKKEVGGLLKFLEDGVRLLHQSEIPFLAYGEVSLYPEVLEFLVEKGVYGVVVDWNEAHSMKELLHQAEKRMILRRTS